MGERFTCTLNTLRKMLRRVCFWFPTVMVETSVTLPSPGETTAPGSWGIVRSGSRKNHKKKNASRTGTIAHTGLVSQPSRMAAASKGAAYRYPSRTMGAINYRAGSVDAGRIGRGDRRQRQEWVAYEL